MEEVHRLDSTRPVTEAIVDISGLAALAFG